MKRTAASIIVPCIALAILVVAVGSITQQASAGAPPGRNAPDAGTVTVAGNVDPGQIGVLLDEFSNRTGHTVVYEGGWDEDDFANCPGIGNCPDVGIVPQPGLMANLAAAGALADLSPFIDSMVLEANYGETWIDLGTVDGTLYGVWFNGVNKSLVWYDPAEFSSHGWMTATNWTELMALSDEILNDTGKPPWSVGNVSNGATGWPLTDWFEDILLRSAGPEVYDQLITHDIPWTHPDVVEAVSYFGEIFGSEAYQLGGKDGTLGTHFIDAVAPLYEDPPEAYLHRQGTFAAWWIDPGQVPGVDYDVFAFPDIDTANTNAVMGSGDITIVFNATAEAQDLVNFLITTDAAELWIEAGNSSPNRSVDFALYPDPVVRAAAQRMANADIFRFDLSDQLPFDLMLFVWTQMDDLVRAAPDAHALHAVLSRIEIHASGANVLYVPIVAH